MNLPIYRFPSFTSAVCQRDSLHIYSSDSLKKMNKSKILISHSKCIEMYKFNNNPTEFGGGTATWQRAPHSWRHRMLKLSPRARGRRHDAERDHVARLRKKIHRFVRCNPEYFIKHVKGNVAAYVEHRQAKSFRIYPNSVQFSAVSSFMSPLSRILLASIAWFNTEHVVTIVTLHISVSILQTHP